MNAFRLTLRNSFKNAFQSPSQLFGLITLITILSLIVSLITAIYTGVINNYQNLVVDSNLRTLVVDMNTDSRVMTGSDANAAGDIPNNNVAAQQTYLYKLNRKYQLERPNWAFDWSRTEERNFSGLKNGEFDLRVKTVAKTTPNTSRNLVDALVINTGHNILSLKQTVLDATFAIKNNVQIGDIIRYQADSLGEQLQVLSSLNDKTSAEDFERLNQIQDLDDPDDIYNQFYSTFNWFQVVGYGESADFMTPTMDAQTPLANKNTELIAYVAPELFGLIKREDQFGFSYFEEGRTVLGVSSSADRDAYYSIRLRNDRSGFGSGFDLPTVASTFNDDLNTLIGAPANGPRLVYAINDSNYKYYNRVWNLVTVINIYNIITGVLLIVVLGVVLFAIALVTRKQVERTRSQIGLMKALGYRKRLMIFNYSVLPFITSVIGSILGFGLSQIIQIPIINDLFGAYFNLDFPVWTFDPIGFIMVIFVTWLIISGIAFMIAWLIMRDSALELISGNKAVKISGLGLFIKHIGYSKTVTGKLRTALLGSSLGKMSVVSLVVFFATVLMTAGFAAPKMLNDNQTQSYTGLKYEQLIDYATPVYNNPYSFMQTYDPTNLRNTYQFAPGLNKITGLPIIASTTDPNVFEYNMDEIITQLLSQQISGEYYGLEIETTQGGSQGPDALEVLFANQKLLNSRGSITNNHFFKLIADWAQIDSFGWNILNNQWPAYIEMIDQLTQQEATYQANPTTEAYVELMKTDFGILQAFYRTYLASVGLTIGRDYYYELSDAANEAYVTHNYAQQIEFFNSSEEGRNAAFSSYKNERKNGQLAFGTVLNSLTLNNNVRISDGNGNLPINSLTVVDDESENDRYLAVNPDTIYEEEGIEGLSQYVSDYLFWYGAFFSQRSGEALIQAIYSRPPYFVQQLFKEAYNANRRNVVYNFAFGVIPFNPRTERLGISLDVQEQNNPDLDFKIYGIENDQRFLDLRNSRNDDLIAELYRTNVYHPLIVNQSLAFKLGLRAGDQITLDLLYEELQNNQAAYSVDNWNQPETRSQADHDHFLSRNDLDVFSTSITTPNSQETHQISAGAMNIDNRPSEYYEAILGGEINNFQRTKPETFTVIGIHNGYGPMQGWMKNSDTLAIMNYEESRNYLWDNFFTQQFSAEFSQARYRARDLYFERDLRTISYQSFLDFYVNDENNRFNVAAIQINRLFNNAYPIFNFKYSLSTDIADLNTGVSTFQAYGDYSPIALNGGQSNGVGYDGMGESSIFGLIPMQISRDILFQLSSVIQAILILLVVVLITITFIIIMLTTSLIINDNIRFISTMKVLGYTNRDIARIVLGMYAIVIMIMFVIGYISGWFIFATATNFVGTVTNFVLPLNYPIWLLFASAGAILGMYLLNFALGYRNVVNNNATEVLQNQEI